MRRAIFALALLLAACDMGWGPPTANDNAIPPKRCPEGQLEYRCWHRNPVVENAPRVMTYWCAVDDLHARDLADSVLRPLARRREHLSDGRHVLRCQLDHVHLHGLSLRALAGGHGEAGKASKPQALAIGAAHVALGARRAAHRRLAASTIARTGAG